MLKKYIRKNVYKNQKYIKIKKNFDRNKKDYQQIIKYITKK